MKILWIVNKIFPYPAEKLGYEVSTFGGWLDSLFEDLKNNDKIEKLAIACTYDGQDLQIIKNEKVVYYLIPCKNVFLYDKNMEYYWRNIVNDFSPDITHIHGTEYPLGLAFLNSCPNEKNITSIQGLLSICGKKINYNAGISNFELLKNITIRDILKRELLINQYKKFLQRGKYEIEILKKTDYIIGRTNWDYANAYDIVKKDKYIKCNESLRKTFYKYKWDINNIDRCTIFVSQASYPIKGFHVMIEALKVLKNIYPEIIVYVGGYNVINTDTFSKKIKMGGYAKYLKKLIKKNNLSENIIFTGLLNEQEVAKIMLKSNVYVQTSSIENSPNSLGEAMLLGLPCVASYVGGTGDMILDKTEGLLYPFCEYRMLAKYISDIFSNDELAIKLGNEARKHAIKTHDRKNNTNKMIEIYNEILNK